MTELEKLQNKIKYLEKTNEELGQKLEKINKIINSTPCEKAGNLQDDVEVIPINLLKVFLK